MRVEPSEVLVDGANGDRALPDCAGDALDGAEPHITGREHARNARLERQGWAAQRPCALGQVAAGQDEPSIIHRDQAAEPVRVRLGSDHHEHGRGSDLFTPTGLNVFECQALQTGLAVAVGNSGAQPDFYVARRAIWVTR